MFSRIGMSRSFPALLADEAGTGREKGGNG
jgi:hypothetical protein